MTQPNLTPETARAIEWLSRLISTPSISRREADATPVLRDWASDLGLTSEMVGDNVLVRLTRGTGPRLVLCTHYDTVPPAAGYTRDPFTPSVEGGRLFGLGSNDAGASLASMLGAAAAIAKRDDWAGTLDVALVVQEEVNGADGAELFVRETGLPDAAIIGEPTALNVCIAQKGLVVLDCLNSGQTCHSANAWRLPHKNAILEAVADIPKVYGVSFDKRDEYLGPTTLHVTVIQGGTVHNSIPDRCEWKVDCRVNPAQSLEEVVKAVRAAVNATVTPRSVRLRATSTPESAAIVQSALRARPQSKTFGSDTMSDMVFFNGCPAIKCGPGMTEMSHQPDEYIEIDWIREGINFYREAALKYLSK